MMVMEEPRRVLLLIDFEQAELVEPRGALDPVVPNKRMWRAEGTGSETTADKSLKRRGENTEGYQRGGVDFQLAQLINIAPRGATFWKARSPTPPFQLRNQWLEGPR